MNALSLGSAFLMGLLGGVHCVLMCGGVVGTLAAGLPKQQSAGARLQYLLSYNAGRITSYTALGLAAGGAGAASSALLPVDVARIAVRLVAALVMLGTGLYLAGFTKVFAGLERMGRPLWAHVEPWARRLMPVRSPGRAIALGMLWGMMPCGLVYAAVALALVAGSAASGAMTMLAFGLGTLPALLVVGGLAEVVRGLARAPRIRQTAGLLIALSGSAHLVMTGLQAGWLPAELMGEKPHCCASHR